MRQNEKSNLWFNFCVWSLASTKYGLSFCGGSRECTSVLRFFCNAKCTAGISKWICCGLCYTRSPRRVSRQLLESEFSSWIFSFWFWKWFHVSGLPFENTMYFFLITDRLLFVWALMNFCLQDYMAHGSQGLFTQVGFNDPSQDDASQSHFGITNPNQLQSQVFSDTWSSWHKEVQEAKLPKLQDVGKFGIMYMFACLSNACSTL